MAYSWACSCFQPLLPLKIGLLQKIGAPSALDTAFFSWWVFDCFILILFPCPFYLSALFSILYIIWYTQVCVYIISVQIMKQIIKWTPVNPLFHLKNLTHTIPNAMAAAMCSFPMLFFPPTLLQERNFVFAISFLKSKSFINTMHSKAIHYLVLVLSISGHLLASCCLYQGLFAQGSTTHVSDIK